MKVSSRIRRKIIESKAFVGRSYVWIQAPLMVSGMVAVLKPYIDNYINIRFSRLILICLVGMLIFGWIDRKLGFYKDELVYSTSQNSEWKIRFDLLNKKMDKVDRKLGEKENV